MATLDELVARVRAEIIEPQPGLYTDPEIKSWLNEANDDLTEIYGVEAMTTIVTASGTEFYAVPADFSRVLRVEREITPAGLDFRPLRALTESDRVEDKGTPVGYYVFAGQIGLVPVPNVVANLNLYYFKKSTTLFSGTDVPVIPSQYHRLLYLYAVGMAKRKADDTAFQTYVSDYIAGRGDMLQKKFQSKFGAQSFPIVRDVG